MERVIRTKLEHAIRGILADRGRSVGPFDDQTALFAGGIGMDSLDFATLVVRLEQELGRDPFRSGQVDRLPRTVGELVALYSPGRGEGTG